MLLKNLIKNSPQSLRKLKIKGLALNSKDVKKGFIFFAVKGNQSNGENYINQAIKNGAIIIICSKSCKFQSTKVNVIKTKKVRKYLSEITSKFYKLKPKNIIAVTGTNGKTSVADFFYQILPLPSAAIPVRAISINPSGCIRSAKASIFSDVPVSSKTKLTSVESTTLARNISANLNASTLLFPVPFSNSFRYTREFLKRYTENKTLDHNIYNL